MATIGWKDLTFIDGIATATYRDRKVVLGEHQIALWREDPDGRFSIKPPLEDQPIELDRFFPSL